MALNGAMLLLGLCLLPYLVMSSSGRAKKDAFESLKEFGPSLGYRPPPPLVRRDAISRVEYDPEKWTSEPHMTISGGIMFDRQTGLTVKQCLNKCARPEFQDPNNRWICRSLTYDHKWKICDLFAITGDAPPYFLSEYRHRDYFRYLAALPPSDVEFKINASREMSAEIQAEEQKFDSTTTTTTVLPLKDVNTTPPPSTLITLPEPLLVEASKTPFEENSAFSPFPVIDSGFDKIDSKEEAAKALASKQTGDATVVIQKPQVVEEKKKTIEYYRKPSLKFSINPIKKVEEVKTETERPIEFVTEKPIEFATERPIEIVTEKLTEKPIEIVAEQLTEKPTEQPIQQETEPAAESSSEKPFEMPKSTPIIQYKTTDIETTTSAKEIKTHQKSIGIAAGIEGEETVEVAAEIEPLNEVRKSIPKKKIQGITTYTLQNSKIEIQKTDGCKSDETARFIQIKKHGRVAELGNKVDASKMEDCIVACINEASFVCNSVVLSQSSCSLFTDVADHGASYSLIKDNDSTYLERICIPERSASEDKAVYEAIRNYILVGQVQEVTDAPTLAKCQIDCLTASENLGFTCKSAMFYPTDIESGQNCLLNSEDHESKSGSFVAEDAGVNMIYIQLSNSKFAEHKRLGLGRLQRLDSPIKYDEAEWTRWSKCTNLADSIRHRYLKCSQKDVRKCPKQSAMCKPRSLQIKKLAKPENECKAVRDSRGNKRCPHGVRYDSRGIRHYCIHPIDC